MIMDDEAQRTLYCGNLDNRVTEEILYELFVQAGPLEKVKLPDGKPFGFITFRHPISVEYTIRLMDGIRLFNKSLRLQPRTGAGNNTPARQNNNMGGNMNMMPNGGNMGNMSPALMGLQGLMGQSPFQRSNSAPQFQSTPNWQQQRFQEDSGGKGRNESPDHRDRSSDRQRDRDNRNNRDYNNRDQNRDRDRSFDRSMDRDQSRDRGNSRDYGKDRGHSRDYGRDRGRDTEREWDNSRDRSQDRGGNAHGNFSRGDTFPQTQRYQQQNQQHLTRQPGFDQDSMAASIDNELRRQRNQQQQQLMQMQFQQQMQEAIQNNFGRPQHRNQGQGQGRYGRRY